MHLHIPEVVTNLISGLIRKKKKYNGLPFVASAGLIRTPVYRIVHDILKHTLIHLRGVEKNLKYWQSVYDKGFFPISDAPEILRTVTRLSRLRRSLCTFLSKVYAESDKFYEPAYLEWDRSKLLVLYIRSINSHFLELEESIQDKTIYPAPATESLSFKNLSFKKLGDEDEDLLLRWSADNFRDTVDLLSSNLNKLDDYVSFLVVKYRKPSKMSRHWMYYTSGAIGVSVFSLWLLRDGRLSGVVHNSKKLVTGLLIDPIKQMTSANRRYEELMKLKQVQSTRDFSSAKELKYPAQNLSGEDSARPTLNQVQKIELVVDTLRESFELRHEISVANERIIATLAAIPAIVFSIGGLMISCVLVRQLLGEGRNNARAAQIRPLVKEVEERFSVYKTECLQGDRHYNHGLMLCTLDRLYIAAESSAKKNGEWQSLREKLIALGKLSYSDSGKATTISHFKEEIACW